MNAKERSVGRIGLILTSALALVATGCATHVHKRTVYVPAPVIVTPPPPVVVAPPPEPPVVVVPPAAPTPVVVIQSESDFYEPLNPHGRWVIVAGYGRCWIPARVEAEWRPYSDGYWQHTDAGWYWASEEPWGWATYHYGRWDWNGQFGWFWVPQTQWAPAWVAWREGGGYVGWAPLRPSVTLGVSITSVNYEPAFASRAYVFVKHRHMMERMRPRPVVVNNTTIINQTVNITRVNVVNQTVINEGPRRDVIERESGRKIRTVAARDSRHREEAAVAGRNRSVARNQENKIETAIGRNVEPPPTPMPSPRKEQPIERRPHVTQPSATTPQPVVVSQPPPTRSKRDEVGRQEDRKLDLPATVSAPGRSTEAKSRVEPPTARPIPNRPMARNVERSAASITKPAESPALPSPARSDVRRKLELVASPAQRLTQVNASSPVTPEMRHKANAPAKPEAKAHLSKGNRPTAPSSVHSTQTPQMSPREKSRSTDGTEPHPDERGKDKEKQAR